MGTCAPISKSSPVLSVAPATCRFLGYRRDLTGPCRCCGFCGPEFRQRRDAGVPDRGGGRWRGPQSRPMWEASQQSSRPTSGRIVPPGDHAPWDQRSQPSRPTAPATEEAGRCPRHVLGTSRSTVSWETSPILRSALSGVEPGPREIVTTRGQAHHCLGCAARLPLRPAHQRSPRRSRRRTRTPRSHRGQSPLRL